jgi:DNA-binding transcriptional LysR family regulator
MGPEAPPATDSPAPDAVLRIGCAEYMQTWPTVRRFLGGVASVTGVEPQTIPGLGRSLLEGVLDKTLDMAIVLGPAGNGRFSHVTLDQEGLLVALPAGHRLAARNRVPVQALAAERLVLFPRRVNPDVFNLYVRALHEADVYPEIIEEPVSEGSRLGVAEGLGFTLAPSSLARTAPLPDVVHRPLAGTGVSIAVTLAWLPGSTNRLLNRVVAALSAT